MAKQELIRTEGWRRPVRFVFWPAQSLRCSLYMIDFGSRLLVDSQWIDDVRGSLSSALRDDISVLNGIDLFGDLMVHQLERGLTAMAVPDFIAWLAGLPADEPALDMPRSPHVPVLDPDGAWYRALDAKEAADEESPCQDVIDRARHLISSPEELRELAVQTATAFWDTCLAEEFARQEPKLREAVERGNRNRAPRTHRELILELVGREPMWSKIEVVDVEDVLAAPVCHVGAFPLMRNSDSPRSTNVYVFEAARMPEPEEALPKISASTYRALADESRLQIIRLLASGESYGVELSKRVGLSQPTVSKHLRVLASEGILKLRIDGLTKHYSLNIERLDQIAANVMDLAETDEQA